MSESRLGPRALGRKLVPGPVQAFVQTEAAGGVVLLVAAVFALVWANSPWGGSYDDLWHYEVGANLGLFRVDLDLRHVVIDGLMTVFFFVVGLEIKREVLEGELASRRKAALPVAAALGGMLVPAGIYAVFNVRGVGSHGWGIPMATDIAFAMGVMALLGRRAPLSLRVFLLALAIVDDLGAIAVIAVFYSHGLSWVAVGWVLALTALVVLVARAGVRSVAVYVLLGALLWLAMLKSGVHATLAGVVLAALTPLHPLEGEEPSPLERLEHALHPWVSFGVMPLFALANAGVALSAGALEGALSSRVTLGVFAGLVLGKPLGIALATLLVLRLGFAAHPSKSGFWHLVGAGLVAGIGFTVAIFVSGLAFDDAALEAEAKIGILAASLVAGVLGFVLLWVLRGEEG